MCEWVAGLGQGIVCLDAASGNVEDGVLESL